MIKTKLGTNPHKSAIFPCIAGIIPPPHIITIKNPEAFAVYLPNPWVARLKIPPHITEVHKPQRTQSIVNKGTSVYPKEKSG